jgi:hypothetical protein
MQGKQLTDLPKWMVRVTVDFMAEGMFKSDYHTIRSQSKAEGQLVRMFDRRTGLLLSLHGLLLASTLAFFLITLYVYSFLYSFDSFL